MIPANTDAGQALFPFLARGVRVGQLPATMRAFHVGRCEFSAAPDRLRRRFAEHGFVARIGEGPEYPTEPGDVVLPDGEAIAMVVVPPGSGDGPAGAREVLLEAYGFLAVSCRQVPSVAAEAYRTLGQHLGLTCLTAPHPPPIDLVAIEPELRRANFFQIEDELFRVHADTEMGSRLRSALGWVGSALQNFACPAERAALVGAINALLRPIDHAQPDQVIDAALRAAIRWDGWGDLGVEKVLWQDQIAQRDGLAIEFRDVVCHLLEQALAAEDYVRDYAGMLDRLGLRSPS